MNQFQRPAPNRGAGHFHCKLLHRAAFLSQELVRDAALARLVPCLHESTRERLTLDFSATIFFITGWAKIVL